MTIDDDNSIYVGGLPYDSSEDSIRRAFDLYGSVVAVKIINDREVGGKCYGFVTFTNPRSAVDAINDMNGRTIGGRVVRVNEVRTRGGRPNFHHENFHRNFERESDWDRGRERERDQDRDRDRYRDRINDRSRDRDRDREREYEHGHDRDRSRDRILDRDRDREELDQERNRSRDRDWDKDRDIDWDRDRDTEKAKDRDRSKDKDSEQESKKRLGPHFTDHRSRELSSDSSDDYHDQVMDQLEISIQRREELQKEIALIEEKFEEKQKLVSDLEKKSQKLEDALATAKKLSADRQTQFSKMQRCFLQVKDYRERLKSCEQELQSLVDTMMVEADDGEGIGAVYVNGKRFDFDADKDITLVKGDVLELMNRESSVFYSSLLSFMDTV